jgi:tRNA-splicing ligase RtcB (3'-phosphate/5'-hydroxy nucleic acid ligase)
VAEVFDSRVAAAYGLRTGDVVVSIHCGWRGLGHQIATEYLREMVVAAGEYGITLPDRELACAPIDSSLGSRYLGAMRAGHGACKGNARWLGAIPVATTTNAASR